MYSFFFKKKKVKPPPEVMTKQEILKAFDIPDIGKLIRDRRRKDWVDKSPAESPEPGHRFHDSPTQKMFRVRDVESRASKHFLYRGYQHPRTKEEIDNFYEMGRRKVRQKQQKQTEKENENSRRRLEERVGYVSPSRHSPELNRSYRKLDGYKDKARQVKEQEVEEENEKIRQRLVARIRRPLSSKSSEFRRSQKELEGVLDRGHRKVKEFHQVRKARDKEIEKENVKMQERLSRVKKTMKTLASVRSMQDHVDYYRSAQNSRLSGGSDSSSPYTHEKATSTRGITPTSLTAGRRTNSKHKSPTRVSFLS